MMTIKLQCSCGQKYAFDVEPVNGMMPRTVACPVCGLDGTAVANQAIAQSLAAAAAAPAAPKTNSLIPEVSTSATPKLRLRSSMSPATPALPDTSASS